MDTMDHPDRRLDYPDVGVEVRLPWAGMADEAKAIMAAFPKGRGDALAVPEAPAPGLEVPLPVAMLRRLPLSESTINVTAGQLELWRQVFGRDEDLAPMVGTPQELLTALERNPGLKMSPEVERARLVLKVLVKEGWGKIGPAEVFGGTENTYYSARSYAVRGARAVALDAIIRLESGDPDVDFVGEMGRLDGALQVFRQYPPDPMGLRGPEARRLQEEIRRAAKSGGGVPQGLLDERIALRSRWTDLDDMLKQHGIEPLRRPLAKRDLLVDLDALDQDGGMPWRDRFWRRSQADLGRPFLDRLDRVAAEVKVTGDLAGALDAHMKGWRTGIPSVAAKFPLLAPTSIMMCSDARPLEYARGVVAEVTGPGTLLIHVDGVKRQELVAPEKIDDRTLMAMPDIKAIIDRRLAAGKTWEDLRETLQRRYTHGQEWREGEMAVDRPETVVLWALAHLNKGQMVVAITDNDKALTHADLANRYKNRVASWGKQEFPELGNRRFSPYVFRNQGSADMKANPDLDRSDVARFLGHLSERTMESYGRAVHGSGRSSGPRMLRTSSSHAPRVRNPQRVRGNGPRGPRGPKNTM